MASQPLQDRNTNLAVAALHPSVAGYLIGQPPGR